MPQLVSVVTPTYNRRDLLPQAIASVLHQTHEDLELIVVDDGSTDDTAGYLRTLTDARIRVLAQTHTGSYSGVRNAGIAAARGEYVAFLDSDDVWAPDKIERQLEALSDTPEAGWCHGLFAMIDARGAVIPFRAGGWEPLTGAVGNAVLAREAAMPMSTLLLKRSAGEHISWFDPAVEYAEDLDLVIRLAEAAPAAAVAGHPIAYLRDHAESTSAGYRAVSHRWIGHVFDRVIARAPTARRRRLARRARRHRISWIANNHAAHGLRTEAWEALRLAGLGGLTSVRWWKALLRLAAPLSGLTVVRRGRKVGPRHMTAPIDRSARPADADVTPDARLSGPEQHRDEPG